MSTRNSRPARLWNFLSSLASHADRSTLASRRSERKRAAPRSLVLEPLEMRTLLATFYVDNTPTINGGGTDIFTASGGTQTNQGGLTLGGDLFHTIQEAVDVASSGDIINVSDGTYNENVTVGAGLTLQGNQAGVDARTARGAESIIDGSLIDAAVAIQANGVIVDGFKVQGGGGSLNAGIYTSNSIAGYDIRNNIITDNVIGVYANSSGASQIRQNLFDGNNEPGSSGGTGIYGDAGDVELTVADNKFINHTLNNPVILGATPSISHTGFQFTGNDLNNSYGVFALKVVDGLFQANSILTTEPGGATALTIADGSANVQVLNNDLSGNLRGLRIGDFGFLGGPAPVSGVVAQFNDLSGSTAFGLVVLTGGYTGTVEASANYWNSTSPAAVAAMISQPDSNVDFTPLLNFGDTNLTAIGFQQDTSHLTVHTLGVQSGTSGRIQEAIDLVADGSLIGAARIVDVNAGTYAENVTVPKSLTLRGANSGINPNTGVRGAETIVVPAAVETSLQSSTSGTIFRLGTAGHIDVTIDGFTIDGHNASLIGGRMLNGVAVHTGAGIVSSTGSFDLETSGYDVTMIVRNNILQNLERYGVYASGVNSGATVLAGSDVSFNKIDNLPSGNNFGGLRGRGIAFGWNVYGSAKYNVMTRVNVGWQTDNHHLASTGAGTLVDNNEIHAYHRGIFHNNQSQNATAATISNNQLFAEISGASTTNFGLELASIQNAVGVTATNNSSTGNVYGVLLWNLTTTGPVSVSGGTLTGNQIGVYATSMDPEFGTALASSAGTISGVTINSATVAGIAVDNFPNIAATSITLGSGNVITGGPTGLLVDGPLTGLGGNTLNNLVFTGQTGNYVTLANTALDNLDIDGTNATYDGVLGIAATVPQALAIEAKLYHEVDDNTLGLIQATPSYTGTGGDDDFIVNIGVANITVTLNSVLIATVPVGSAVLLDGLGGTDTVTVQDGTGSGNTLQIGNATVALGASSATWVNVELSFAEGLAGDDTFAINGPSGTIALRGGDDNDTFVFADGASVNGAIHGGNGDDKLDYSAYTTPVSVNLNAGTATGTTNITSIRDVTGGSGADTIVADSQNNILSGGGGSDTINGGFGTDTLIESGSGNYILTNASLVNAPSTDTLSEIEVAQLTSSSAGAVFTVGGWTGIGTLTASAGGGTVAATKTTAQTFTLTDSLLATTDLMSFSLSGINTANLVGSGANGDLFDISLWSGGGSLNGGAGTGDKLLVNRNAATYTLGNTSLAVTGSPTITLAGLELADLTGEAGTNNTFILNTWTGGGTITGGGDALDTIRVSRGVNMTLTDTQLTIGVTQNLTLSGIKHAFFTGTGSAHTYTLSGWTGTAQIDAVGVSDSDKLVVTKDASSFTLGPSSLVVAGGPSVTFTLLEIVELKGGASSNEFNVNGYTGKGTIRGEGASDTLNVSGMPSPTTFTLTNTSFKVTGGQTLTLASLETANLTGGTANDVFTVGGWSNGLSIDGGGGSGDKISVTRNALDWVLTTNNLATTGFPTMNLTSVAAADLIASGTVNNTFDVSGWSGTGKLTAGTGSDTLFVTKDVASLSLTPTAVNATGGFSMTHSGFEIAELVGGAGANDINASTFTGQARLYGLANNDVLAGGSGKDVLLGGDGDDNLNGGGGNDLLIGGDGIDVLFGGGGDDILIGGYTSYDTVVTGRAALVAIMAEWGGANSYATRVNNIRNAGVGSGPYFLNNTTVVDDSDVDSLYGQGNTDWFLEDVPGEAQDEVVGETVDFIP